MMMVIEYFNILTKGKWSANLKNKPFAQIVIAALLGAIPGCLGTYTSVSLYTHGIFSFGALTSSMIATFGDEAFVMFAMIPDAAIKIMLVSFIVAIIVGIVTNYFTKNKSGKLGMHFHIHEDKNECVKLTTPIFYNLKHISFSRAILIFSISVFLLFLLGGGSGHNHVLNLQTQSNEIFHTHKHENSTIKSKHNDEYRKTNHESHHMWVKITFAIVSLVALYITLSVSEHFLEKHLWEHVIKKHFLKILLWTLGVLLFVFILQKYINLDNLIHDNLYIILIVAVLIGIIPESGPHLVFVSLFISGTIPLSILIANSIVQDGHGALPLFAEDKKGFVLMKMINMTAGLLIGGLGLYYGW
jgi:hypothetical protein